MSATYWKLRRLTILVEQQRNNPVRLANPKTETEAWLQQEILRLHNIVMDQNDEDGEPYEGESE